MKPLKNYSDAELLTMLRVDNRAAFEELFSRHWTVLYRAACRRMDDKEEVKDIVQNVLADLWLRRHTLVIKNLSAFLQTAVRFQLFKHVSRTAKTSFLEEFDELITSPVAADDQLREKELMHIIELWLATLPEKRRKIFMMHFAEDLSTKEIAVKLGLSQKTVQSQLYVSTQNFRARLSRFLIMAIVIDMIFRFKK